MNVLYRFISNFATFPTTSLGKFRLNAILLAWNPVSPTAGSITSLKIFSGDSAATSSISMPPSSDPIKRYEKYYDRVQVRGNILDQCYILLQSKDVLLLFLPGLSDGSREAYPRFP